MALPKKIAPYSYRDQEHQNRVNWRVDPARAALLVHDMQRYFVRAFELERNGQTLPDAQINIAIANIRRLVDAAHAANIPVYYTAQPPRQNPADRRLLTDFWGDGLQDDESAQILDELAPPRPILCSPNGVTQPSCAPRSKNSSKSLGVTSSSSAECTHILAASPPPWRRSCAIFSRSWWRMRSPTSPRKSTVWPANTPRADAPAC
ncbi:isochorismatase of siderophore biosynthesis [Rothia aeria]|uniref:Isochorismatase of siderophore biosynthesis n=1 Tax=Rothia aeria TaxID=172042 RepID=A0A2Z5QVN2_9MICC|nr:isochorismatase of siderophore biosynthesis [Rothia aeria]